MNDADRELVGGIAAAMLEAEKARNPEKALRKLVRAETKRRPEFAQARFIDAERPPEETGIRARLRSRRGRG